MNVVDTMRDLGTAVGKRYTDVNCGGCCVYASIVGQALKDRGYKVLIRVQEYHMHKKDRLDIMEKKRQVTDKADYKAWWKVGIEFNHVILQFGAERAQWLHDFKRTVLLADKFGEHYLHHGHLTVREAAKLAEDRTAWNSMFNRAQIPHMAKFVGQFLDRRLGQASDLDLGTQVRLDRFCKALTMRA